MVERTLEEMFDALNTVLDSFGGREAEELCRLHDMAQAALEARLELDRRA